MRDVRMPDGTVITNVPEGTTQRELLSRLQSFRGQAPVTPQPAPEVGVGQALQPLASPLTGGLAAPELAPGLRRGLERTVIGALQAGADVAATIASDPANIQELRELLTDVEARSAARFRGAEETLSG